MRTRAFVTLVMISLMIWVGTASALQLQTAPAKKAAPAAPAKTAPAQTPPAPTASTSAVGGNNMNYSMPGRLVVEYTTSESIDVKIKAKLLRLDGKSLQGQKICLIKAECAGDCSDHGRPCGITDGSGSVTIACDHYVWCHKSEQPGEHHVTLSVWNVYPLDHVEGTGRFLVTKTKTHLDASQVTVKRQGATFIGNTADGKPKYDLAPRAKICGIRLIATTSGIILNPVSDMYNNKILVNWSPRLSSGSPATAAELCYNPGWMIPEANASVPGQNRTWQFTAEFPGNERLLPAPKITFNISENNIH